MRSSPLRRVIAALLAVWFTLVSVDPAWLHACPMHGAAHAGAQHGRAGVTTDAHAQHAAHPSAPAESPAAPQCLCLGDCQAGSASVLPHSVRVAVVATPVTMVARAIVPTRQHIGSAQPRAHSLPFAHAPPVHLA